MKKATEKQVQIPLKLFVDLITYFFVEADEKSAEAIRKALDVKLEALAKHEQYTLYKTGETEAEREKARKKYLDSVGMRESFRW